MKQRTIQKEIIFSGVGLHTGKITSVKLIPAADNHGIVFKRTDLSDQPSIPADVGLVTSTNRPLRAFQRSSLASSRWRSPP